LHRHQRLPQGIEMPQP
jgi:hypothetical protein